MRDDQYQPAILVQQSGTMFAVPLNGSGGGTGPVDWDSVHDKPETFPPSSHRHPVADIDGLTVDGNVDLSDYATKTYVDAAVAGIETDGGVGLGTALPEPPGTAAVGTSEKAAHEDHVHAPQSSVTGNAGTATKLATARTITLDGDCTGSATFDGSENVTITTATRDINGDEYRVWRGTELPSSRTSGILYFLREE